MNKDRTAAVKCPTADAMQASSASVEAQVREACTDRESALGEQAAKQPGKASEERPRIVIIAGPTAVGKTALSLELARRLNGEIINADSVQVYRGLDIGSAKLPLSQRQGIAHHLIDILEPDVHYDVAAFQAGAARLIEDISARAHVPIVVGGTGFYIRALLYGTEFGEEETETQQALRAGLEAEAGTPEGAAALYERLRACDLRACESIHPNNIRRVIRALEYFALHGEPISAHNEAQRRRPPAYRAAFFVLNDGREALYQRIDARVTEMFAEGLEAEVRGLYERGFDEHCPAMQAIGYRELLPYLRGEQSLEEAADRIRQHTRNYAKRQLTWFRREKDCIWLDIGQFKDKEDMTQWVMKQCMRVWA